MNKWTADKNLVDETVKSFPATFGLTSFPDKTFRIDANASYVNDSEQVKLVIEVKRNEEWLSFANVTIAELSDFIVISEPAAITPATPKPTTPNQMNAFTFWETRSNLERVEIAANIWPIVDRGNIWCAFPFLSNRVKAAVYDAMKALADDSGAIDPQLFYALPLVVLAVGLRSAWSILTRRTF